MSEKRSFTDQMGRAIQFSWPPQRIISLVPSQTELLADLGAEDQLAGITKFCIHPERIYRGKPRVGGTKKYDLEKIAALQPDLIIGNKEENEELQLKSLMQQYPVWMSDIKTLHDALGMILELGKLVNREKQAEEMTEKIKQSFALLNSPQQEIKTVYLIWREPWMAAGKDTFINHLMMRCGFSNMMLDRDSRYPEFTLEELQAVCPELILLSSEPYPFKEKHIQELQAVCPSARIELVDGEMFSWYGSRLLQAARYLNKLVQQLS